MNTSTMQTITPVKTWTVVYRAGGTQNCTWTRILERYVTEDDALAKQQQIEREGYKALVYVTAMLDEIGLPIGWSPQLVDFSKDEITIGPLYTRVVRAPTKAGEES
jgi:hypothetical protein